MSQSTAMSIPTSSPIARQPSEDRSGSFTHFTAADGTVTSYPLDSFATYGVIPDNWQKDATITGLTIGQGVDSIGECAFDGCDDLVGDLVIPSSVNVISNGAFKDVGLSGTLTLGSYEETYELWWAEGFMDDTMVYTTGGVDYRANWYNGYPLLPGLFDPYRSSVSGIVSTRAFQKTGTVTVQYYIFNGGTLRKDVVAGTPAPAFNNENPATDPAELTIQNFSGDSGGAVTNHYWKQITQMTIGNNAFEGAGFTGLNILGGITSIGNDAFAGCSGLNSCCLGTSITSIGERAFANCTSVTSVTIPEGVTTIGEQAFGSCTGLTSLTIPSSVTSIAYLAFYNCSNLTTINCRVTKTIFEAGGYAIQSSGVTAIHALASDTTWTEGAGQTIASKTGITVTKDLT